jgi:hypothetical protein
MPTITIRNNRIEMTVDRPRGRIVQIRDLVTGIQLIAEERLAENLRVLVSVPGHRGWTIRLAEVSPARISGEGSHLRLAWDCLPGPDRILQIGLELTIDLLADGFTCRTTVDHRDTDDCVVEEVYTPALGGLGESDPAVAAGWILHQPGGSGTGDEYAPFTEIRHAYLGPPDPVNVRQVQSLGWIDLYHRDRRHGVYLCCEDVDSGFGAWWVQSVPGADWGGDRWVWPTDGRPRGLVLAWVAFPYCRAGSTWTSAPLVVRFHAGIWYEAARLYREFYDRHWRIDRSRAWLWLEDAWQSTIISYPDDTIGYRFADLPDLARQAQAAGIRVLQIDGWDVGGIDRDYPHYQPDPRLGGAEDLRRALTACEEIGCRVLLFANLHQVNLETAWYREELHRYTMRNIFDQIPASMGWEYHTAGGLIGHRQPLMVDCNPAHPRFAAIMDDAYRGIARLGAAGCQVDKVCIGPRLDFHAALPATLRRDQSWVRPTLEAFARHAAIGAAERPDFALASETHWDRLFPLVEVAYARHWYADKPQSCTVTFPEHKQTCCVTGPTDFALVNNCLRLGLVINIEAACLHRGSGDVPGLIPHLRRVRALRRKLWDLLWLGQMADPHGCTTAIDAGMLISRWTSRAPGARGQALVLCHFQADTRSATVTVPEAGRARIHRLDGSTIETTLPAVITVPSNEPVVVEAIAESCG